MALSFTKHSLSCASRIRATNYPSFAILVNLQSCFFVASPKYATASITSKLTGTSLRSETSNLHYPFIPLRKMCAAASAPSPDTSNIVEVDKSFIETIIANDLQLDGKSYVLLDVRKDWEVLEHGMIEKAKQLELDKMEKLQSSSDEFEKEFKFEKPKKDQILVMYCRSGKRSLKAAAQAIACGYDSVSYKGSYIEWFGKTYDV